MTNLTHRPRKRLSREQLENSSGLYAASRPRKPARARRDLAHIHQQLPKPARALFDPLAPAFRQPTHHRFVLLAVAAILTLGGHTDLQSAPLPGRAWPPDIPPVITASSPAPLGAPGIWRADSPPAVLSRFAPQGVIELAGDDTVAEHPGPKVYGKGCHRDPVRSTHSFTAFRWGHKWVVLALLVRLPFTTRRWALPLLMALYQSEEENRRQGRRHKTPPQLLRQCSWC